MTDWNEQAMTIFGEAAEIVDASERKHFLDKACGDNADLRQRVDSMISANERAALGDFLDAPVTDIYQRNLVRPAEAVGSMIGKYKILQEIGEGGFGVVYMAQQTEPVKRRVALKIIKPGMDSREVIARFEAERQALALMDHPNIAKVADAGTTEDRRPFFVMELVKGVPITEFCDANNLPTHERLDLFASVCRAVQHAHQKGIIHRDLKPSNVMVTLNDGEPMAKVIDFGVAKAINQELTEKTLFTAYGAMVGTPVYMSPEQAEMSGLDIDTRSDVYSLGVLLYELLTGAPPIDATRIKTAGLDEMRRIIREEEPPKPSTRLSSLGKDSSIVAARHSTNLEQLRRHLRGELDWIVMRALEKDRNRRYQTALDFAADVRNHLTGEPVNACPPTFQYRLTKYARRNKGPVAFASTVMGLLLLSSIVAWSLFARANSARNRERAAKQEARSAAETAQNAQKEAEAQRTLAQRSLRLAESRGRDLTRRLYYYNISKADEASRKNDTHQVKTLLDSCLPEQRGWEWHYLATKALVEKRLQLPVGAILSMASSPVVDDVFVIDSDGQIGRYKLSDGSKVWSKPLPFSRPFKPFVSDDGKYISFAKHYTLRQGKFVALRSDTGEQIWERQLGDEQIAGGVFSFPNHSNLILIAQFDYESFKGTVSCVEMSTDKTLWSYECPASFPLLGFSLDGSSLFVSEMQGGTPRSDSTLVRLDTKDPTVEPAVAWRKSRKGVSSAVAVSPDLRSLVCGGENSFEVRDMESGEIVQRVAEPGRGLFFGIASPCNEFYWSVNGSMMSIRRWSDHSDVHLFRTSGDGMNRPFGDMCFYSDEQRVVTTNGNSNFIDIRPIVTPLAPLELVTTVGWHIARICYSQDGDTVFGISTDGVLSRWDPREGKLLETKKFDGTFAMDISPDGQFLALGGNEHVLLIDINTWDVVHEWQDSGWWFAFTKDGQRIIYGGDKGKLVSRELPSGSVTNTQSATNMAFPDNVDGLVALDESGDRVAAVMQNERRLSIWNLEQGSFENLFSLGFGVRCRSLSFSSKTGMLAAGIDNQVEVWDPKEGELKLVLKGHRSPIGSVLFDRKGKRIFSQDFAGVLKIWDAESGEDLLTLAQEDNRTHYGALALSPDGRTLAAAGRGRAVQLWETRLPAPNIDRRRRLVRDATEIVDHAFEESNLVREVLDILSDNSEIAPEIRRTAIDIANARGDQEP